jgi:hypothetical protein
MAFSKTARFVPIEFDDVGWLTERWLWERVAQEQITHPEYRFGRLVRLARLAAQRKAFQIAARAERLTAAKTKYLVLTKSRRMTGFLSISKITMCLPFVDEANIPPAVIRIILDFAWPAGLPLQYRHRLPAVPADVWQDMEKASEHRQWMMRHYGL